MERAAEELRDRVLKSVVRELRQRIAEGQSAPDLVSALLGSSQLWPAPVVSDADFAAAAAVKRRAAGTAAPVRPPLVTGTQTVGIVTAVCQAPATGELFLGYTSGRVLSFLAGSNRLQTIAETDQPVVGLASDLDGKTLVFLGQSDQGCVVSCCRRAPDRLFHNRHDIRLATRQHCWLTPLLTWGNERLLGLGDGRDLLIIEASSGILRQRITIADETAAMPATAILVPAAVTSGAAHKRLTVLTHDGPRLVFSALDGSRHTLTRWAPAIPKSSSLRSIPLTARFVPPSLDLLGIDPTGAIYRAQFHVEDGSIELVAEQVARTAEGYLATTDTGTNKVVGIAPGRIDWLDGFAERFSPVQRVDVSLPFAVACYHLPASREILVVCADGFIARVAAPIRFSRD